LVITKIELQKRNKDRASIYIDEEFAFGLHVNVVYDLGLKKGMEIDEDFKSTILAKEETKQAHLYALKLVNYRPRCQSEVRRKMAEKGYAPEIIDETIDYLINYNFLNDEEFTRLYIESKIDINKYGFNRIRYQLGGMGIARDIIDRCIAEYSDTTDEYPMALSQAEKKVSSMSGDDYRSRYRKLSGFLGRKGYSYDVISKVLKEVLGDSNE